MMKDGFGATESVVLSLLEDYHDKGHIVFTDNFYSSPNLFNELQQHEIGACGTVKPSRQNMPVDLNPRQLVLQKGDPPAFRRWEDLIACAWHDTKRVHFLSNVSGNGTIDKEI
jgi:hypothetical protein